MDFATLLPYILGSVTTLAGVWITTQATARTERRRLELETSRDQIRINREDEAARAQASLAEQKRARDVAEEIADLFLTELETSRAWNAGDGHTFAGWYVAQWRAKGEITLRRAIAKVSDSTERQQLIEILDATDDYEGLANWNFNFEKEQVEKTLTLGFDLASTMARSQDADPAFVKRYEVFQRDISGLESYRQDQREGQREARRAATAAKEAEAAAAETHEPDSEPF
jgi:hypothetical protein